MNRTTQFSTCRRYRYTLWREFENELARTDRSHKFVQFIGLNPSTADETKDDPTIRRCVGFAKAWGYGAICMTNLFAWRDTSPDKMKQVENPIGELNDYWLMTIAHEADLTVAAWGNHGSHRGRESQVRELITVLHCLRETESGMPEHPLYLPKNLIPVLL